jgi:hypothetical protein
MSNINNTPNTLNAAMVAALGSLHNVQKNAVNPHFKSKFATLDAILDNVRPVLAKHGLALSQEPVFTEGMAGVVTRIIHSGGESRESTLLLPLRDQSAQGVGNALTYARRYAVSSVLGIASDEDEDGNQASQQNKFAAAKASVASKPPKKTDITATLVAMMDRDKITDDDIFGFLKVKGAKVDAEYIPDLPVSIQTRLVDKWTDVIDFAIGAMKEAA